jgi:predicted metal-dependent hydrolase
MGIGLKPEIIDQWNKGARAFNEGRFWDAHEIWEEIWKNSGGVQKTQIQGFIQACAILVHLKKNDMDPARRLALACVEKLEQGAKLPFKISGLEEFLESLLNGESSWNNQKIQTLKADLLNQA